MKSDIVEIGKKYKFFCIINGSNFKFEGIVERETEFYFDIVDIKESIKFEDIIEKVRDYDEAYICQMNEEEVKARKGKILALVGPEGGFSKSELIMAEEKEIKKIKLSNTILRTETAGMAAIMKLIG